MNNNINSITDLNNLSNVELLEILKKHFSISIEGIFASYIEFSIDNNIDSGYDCFRTWSINYINRYIDCEEIAYYIKMLKKC